MIERLFFLLIVCVLGWSSLGAQDAKEIVRKAEDKMRGKTSVAEMVITTSRPKWKRSMEVKAWLKGVDFALLLIRSPAKDKGIVFLKRKKEVWNWLPTLERTIKLPPSMMSQSWMGTDFTNDDLVKESSVVEDYEHALLGSEKIEGRDCFKIQLTPKPEAAVVWGKILLWIDKAEYLQLKTEFYDDDGELESTMKSYDIKTLGGRLLPSRFEMISADKPNQKTEILYKSIVFDNPISDDFFTTQNMLKVK